MINKPLIAANLECHRKEKELRVLGPWGRSAEDGTRGSMLEARASNRSADLFCRSAAPSLWAGKNRGFRGYGQRKAADLLNRSSLREQTGIVECPRARIPRPQGLRGIDAGGRSRPRRGQIRETLEKKMFKNTFEAGMCMKTNGHKTQCPKRKGHLYLKF